MGQSPSFEEIDVEIKRYFQKVLNWSLEFTDVLMDDPTLDREEEAADMPEKIEGYKGQIKSGKFSPSVQADAFELLAPYIAGDNKPEVGALKYACRGIARAKAEQYLRLIADLTGEFSSLNASDPLFAGMMAKDYAQFGPDATETSVETLQVIANRFRSHKEERGDAEKTLSDFDVTMRWVYEVISPDKPITSVTDADIRDFRDLVGSIPANAGKMKTSEGKSLVQLAADNKDGPKLSAATQEKRLRFFKSCLRWASNEGYIAKVPGNNVSIGVKKSSEDPRVPYDYADLERIFLTPVYMGRASVARSSTVGIEIIKDGKYWVPIIGLFSGMRLGEIVQLQVADVFESEGIWVFDINKNEDKYKKAKTKASIRKVPIHKTLIDLGILDVCAKSSPSKRIFEDLPIGSDGYYSHNFSKWWGRYGRTFEFHQKHKVFHSFRHLFIDSLRNLEAQEYVIRKIVGHTDDSVTGGYGVGANLKVKKSLVDDVTFDVASLNMLLDRDCKPVGKG